MHKLLEEINYIIKYECHKNLFNCQETTQVKTWPPGRNIIIKSTLFPSHRIKNGGTLMYTSTYILFDMSGMEGAHINKILSITSNF